MFRIEWKKIETVGVITIKKRPIFGEMKKRLHGKIVEVMDKEDPVFIEPLRLMM